ncbi:hypothetical protein F511_07996 [Dorcoceras hygrometricum]|uniref:Uncharacterized protein n=1 Tax=Dorcoceras hygrometricum TaxID=472368 RepID=A0A2Z7BWW2_9LAMI|nr:hypothetical protein F511_07996 [Dorcoceras hygrometricum]
MSYTHNGHLSVAELIELCLEFFGSLVGRSLLLLSGVSCIESAFYLCFVPCCIAVVSYQPLCAEWLTTTVHRLATAGGVIDAPGIGERVGVIQLVEEVTQLAVPQEVVECPSSIYRIFDDDFCCSFDWGFKCKCGSTLRAFSNPISVDCRRFSPPFGVILVALRSSSLGLSISTSFEAGVAGFEEREVVPVFVCLCDCGPIVLLFFNTFGIELILRNLNRFEIVLASAELPWSCLGSELELVAAPCPSCCKIC